MAIEISDLPAHLQAQARAKLGASDKPKRGAVKPQPVDKADDFAALWPAHLPQPVREYRFQPGRKRRFDFAWPELKVAVEVDGGQWSSYGGGRHNTDTDRDKRNAAAALGWRILYFSPDMLKDAGAVIGVVSMALGVK